MYGPPDAVRHSVRMPYIAHCVWMPYIYTAPLADILRFHAMQVHFYADDTQLYTSFSVNNDLELIIRS